MLTLPKVQKIIKKIIKGHSTITPTRGSPEQISGELSKASECRKTGRSPADELKTEARSSDQGRSSRRKTTSASKTVRCEQWESARSTLSASTSEPRRAGSFGASFSACGCRCSCGGGGAEAAAACGGWWWWCGPNGMEAMWDGYTHKHTLLLSLFVSLSSVFLYLTFSLYFLSPLCNSVWVRALD